MVNNVLKYRTGNIMILYCYAYSVLLDTMKDIIQNSMWLIRSVGSYPQIDEWLEWSMIYARRVESIQMLDSMW